MFAMNTYQEFHSSNPPLIKRNIKKQLLRDRFLNSLFYCMKFDLNTENRSLRYEQTNNYRLRQGQGR
jgi:hypothetical protein